MTTMPLSLMEANKIAHQKPEYAEMMKRRPEKKHRVYDIGNGIYFEYWSKSEWEFTVANSQIDHSEILPILIQLIIEIKSMKPTADKLDWIISRVTNRLAKFL